MCPDKKILWFEASADWRPEDRAEVDRIVRLRWTETYKNRAPPSDDPGARGSSSSSQPSTSRMPSAPLKV